MLYVEGVVVGSIVLTALEFVISLVLMFANISNSIQCLY
jgi:hypothetical protein